MATGEQTYDDLTLVKGIGKKRQAWLQEEMHIYRYADLAALSAAELETRLREAGQLVPQNAVREWIDQATQLMASTQPGEEKAEIPALASEDIPHQPPKKFPDWHPFASFVVEYQERTQNGQKQLRTTAHHVEADRGEMWPGVVQEALCQWMQDQAGVHLTKTEAALDTAVTEEIMTEEIMMPEKVQPDRGENVPKRLAVKQLLVYQPPESNVPAAVGESGRPFMGNVRADKPCVLAVLFEVSHQNGAATRDDIKAQLFARNLATRSSIQLPIKLESSAVPGGETLHKIEFASTSLPAGAYRFEIILRVNKPLSNIESFVELPILHVLA